jgi:hypothetical protein
MKKLVSREVKKLVQDHPVQRWYGPDSNPTSVSTYSASHKDERMKNGFPAA